MHTKNGWPWAGLINTNLKANNAIIEKLISLWNSTDWGNSFENYIRPAYQGAIYPYSRARQISESQGDTDLEEITSLVYDELKPLFKENMMIFMAELNCLIPKGRVDWHHDRMTMCHNGTRIILPLFNIDDTIFSFASWSDRTPTDKTILSAKKFMDTDVVSMSIDVGSYYIYNHRVPHCTKNLSDKPRGMYAIELIPEQFYEKANRLINDILEFKEISNEEKTKIIPTINVSNIICNRYI